MDAAAFDRMTRGVERILSRRAALAGLAGAGLAARGSAGWDAGAKKTKCKKPNTKCGKTGCCKAKSQICLKGKCVRACQFTADRRKKTLTLKANCTLTNTFEIADGFTLDGKGKTIRLAGSPAGFDSVALRPAPNARDITVRRLTIDAARLSQQCDDPAVVALHLFTTRSRIADVTIQNTGCFPALAAGKVGGRNSTVTMTNTTIKNAATSGAALGLLGPLEATIASCTFSEIANGFAILMDLDAPVTAAIRNSTFTKVFQGVVKRTPGTMTVTNNQWQGVTAGIIASNGRVDVTDNTIVGPGSDTTISASAGVLFQFGASGSVSGNTISNFLADGSGPANCGILLDEDAGDVTIGTNTFPDPPGNEQNVCDFRT